MKSLGTGSTYLKIDKKINKCSACMAKMVKNHRLGRIVPKDTVCGRQLKN